MILLRKTKGFAKLISRWIIGIFEDAPYIGYWASIRLHFLPLRNQIRYYSGLPPRDENFCIHVRGYQHPMLMRPRTSDYQAYRQIFVEREYGLVDEISDVNFIVDCGANAGYASIYFLRRFPTARIIAIEPDPENASLCRENLAPYGSRITVREGGVWSTSCELTLLASEFGPGNKWGVAVRARRAGDADSQQVQGWGLETILDKEGGMRLDLLKVDIEGSESEVFGAPGAQDWLLKVRNLVIELHGPACAQTVFDALKPYRYLLRHCGDLTYFLDLIPFNTTAKNN